MLWLLLLTIATIAVVAYRRHRYRAIYELSKAYPFGIPSYPVIGHAYIFRGTDEDRMDSIKKMGNVALQHGGLCTVWIGSKLYSVIADPEMLEIVSKTCLEKDPSTMKFIRHVLGNGIIFAPTKFWRPRRKIMAPTFNMKNLQAFVSIFDKQSAIMVEQMRWRADGGDFSSWEYFTTYTFDSICETVLGVELNAQKTQHHVFITAFDVLSRIIAKRALSPWLYWDWVFRLTKYYKPFVTEKKNIYDFFEETLRAKRKQLAEATDGDGLESTKTFLDLMIESSEGACGYSDIELREEILSIVSAGTDTTAVSTAFTAVMLSRNPHVQNKVYEELKEVYGNSDRPVTWQDLPKLTYLEAVIKETLRLYPPVPLVTREIDKTIVLPNGAKLVPGMAVFVHVWNMHRNTKYWGEDVEQFRPERFLEGPIRHPAQFVPFSYSLRNCIGANYAMMSTKTNLSNLLRHYVLLPPTSVPADQLTRPLRVQFDIMTKDCDNFEIRIQSRN